jgi:hypothetical protein
MTIKMNFTGKPLKSNLPNMNLKNPKPQLKKVKP